MQVRLSEIVNQIIELKLDKLIIIDKSETDLFILKNRIIKNKNQISFYVDDVCDDMFLQSIFLKYQPNIVFHAAAYKHVYMMENNPSSAIKNNVIGTDILLKNAIKVNAEKVIIISSDKAVNPSNVMGASKELLSYYPQNILKIKVTQKLSPLDLGMFWDRMVQ